MLEVLSFRRLGCRTEQERRRRKRAVAPIYDALAEAEPRRIEWQRDHSTSRELIGTVFPQNHADCIGSRDHVDHSAGRSAFYDWYEVTPVV